jgi:CBS domain-containing protein
MKPGSPIRHTPIHERLVLSGDGAVARTITVPCSERGVPVGLVECARCEAFLGMVADVSTRRRAIACAQSELPASRAWELDPDRVRVTELMSPSALCVTEDVAVAEVATLFLERGISAAPVVDRRGQPLGMVTKTDLVRGHLEDGDAPQDEPPPEVASLGRGYHVVRLPGTTAADLMMPLAFTLPEDASVRDAAAMMAVESVHHVPVVDASGAVVGVISALDLARWIAGALPASDRRR